MMVAAFPATAPAQNYSLRELLQEGLQNSYSLKLFATTNRPPPTTTHWPTPAHCPQ